MVASDKTSRQAERVDRRAMLLDTAAERFAVRGYVEASMRELAQMLGIKAASLYYHFPSKEALLLEVCRVGVTSLIEYLDEMLTQEMPIDARVEALFLHHLDMLRRRGNYLMVYMRDRRQLPADALAELARFHDGYRDRVDTVIRVAQADGTAMPDLSADSIHQLLVALLKHLNELFFGSADRDLTAFCRDAAMIIGRGLKQTSRRS